MSNKIKCATPCAIIEMIISAGALLALYVAITMDGSWTLGTNYLHDLASSSNATAAAIFKWTCIIGGLLVLIAAALRIVYLRKYDRASAVFYLIAAIGVIAYGLMATKTMDHHISAMYLIVIIAMILSSISDSYAGRKLTACAGLVLFLVIVASFFGFNTPTIEVICAVCACAWVFVQGLSIGFRKAA